MLGHYSSAEQLCDGPVIVSEDLLQDVRRVLPKQGGRAGLWHLELTVSHSWACQRGRKAGNLLMTNPQKFITQAAWGVWDECQEYHCQLHPCKWTVILERTVFAHMAFLDLVLSNCAVVLWPAHHHAGGHMDAPGLSQRRTGVGHSIELTFWVPENSGHGYIVSLRSWKSDPRWR